MSLEHSTQHTICLNSKIIDFIAFTLFKISFRKPCSNSYFLNLECGPRLYNTSIIGVSISFSKQYNPMN